MRLQQSHNQKPVPFTLDLTVTWPVRSSKEVYLVGLTNAYYQMRIKEDEEWKTVFQTKYCHINHQVMLFGLFNASASFQSYINKILAEKLNIFVIVYLDDIFIYTKDPGQVHIEVVWWVLDILRNNGLFTNLKKYWFYKDKLQSWVYVVLSQGILIEDKRNKAVKN